MTEARVTTICLVRHGETDWNAARLLQGRRDISLNQRGREQARLTGLHLQQWSWGGVVSSPQARARESAQIIAGVLEVPLLRFLDDLMEIDVGEACGLTREEADSRWPDGIPGYETHDSLSERGTRAIETLVREHAAQRLVVVTHGALLNAVLASVSLGEIGSGKTRLSNACLNLLSHEAGKWVIEYHNQVGHLAEIAHLDNE